MNAPRFRDIIMFERRTQARLWFPTQFTKLRMLVPRAGTPQDEQSGASITRLCGGMAMHTHRTSLSSKLKGRLTRLGTKTLPV